MHESLINPLSVLLLFLLFFLAGLSLFILCKIMLIVLFKGTLVNSEVTSKKKKKKKKIAITLSKKFCCY